MARLLSCWIRASGRSLIMQTVLDSNAMIEAIVRAIVETSRSFRRCRGDSDKREEEKEGRRAEEEDRKR